MLQIDFLKREHPTLTIRVITKLFGICNYIYFSATINNESQSSLAVCSPSQRYLSNDEEHEIIVKIHVCQMQNDCINGKGILSIAREINARRTGIQKQISLDGLMDIRERQKIQEKKILYILFMNK